MFERQIIMVTHNDHLASIGTTSYRVDLRGSESQIQKNSPPLVPFISALDIYGKKSNKI